MKANKGMRNLIWTLTMSLFLGAAISEARPRRVRVVRRPNGSTVVKTRNSVSVATTATVESEDEGSDWTRCYGSYLGSHWMGLGRTNSEGIWETAAVYTDGSLVGYRTRYFGTADWGVSFSWDASGNFSGRSHVKYKPLRTAKGDQENPNGLTIPTDDEVGL